MAIVAAIQAKNKTADSASQNIAVRAAPSGGTTPTAVIIPIIAHNTPRIARIQANTPIENLLLFRNYLENLRPSSLKLPPKTK